MTEEEQKAIEKLKHHIEFAKEFPSECFDTEIKIGLNYICKLEKDIKEWFDIADNILRATDKYGEISIGEVADYIFKLQSDIEIKDKVIEKAFKYIDEHTYRDMEECEFGETNNFTCIKDCDTCIKQYFYEKVEEENE